MNRETYEKAVKLHQKIEELQNLIISVNNSKLTFLDSRGNPTNIVRLKNIAEAHREQIYNSLHAEKTKLEREIEEL